MRRFGVLLCVLVFGIVAVVAIHRLFVSLKTTNSPKSMLALTRSEFRSRLCSIGWKGRNNEVSSVAEPRFMELFGPPTHTERQSHWYWYYTCIDGELVVWLESSSASGTLSIAGVWDIAE